MTLVAECGDGAETRPLRPPKQAINNFTLNEAAEERNVFGSIQQIQEARTRLQQIDGGFPDRDAPSL